MSAGPDVTIIDDDEAIRGSLGDLLRSEGLKVTAHPSAESYLAAEETSGCLVVDIHMPGLSGLELQAELRRRGRDVAIIVITGQGDVPKAVTALKAGAVDFLEKPYDVEHLLSSIRHALNQSERRERQGREIMRLQSRLAGLSRRERQVMDLMVLGQPNKVIAQSLGISPRTVENHRASVMDKMQCDNLSMLIHLILGLDQRVDSQPASLISSGADRQ